MKISVLVIPESFLEGDVMKICWLLMAAALLLTGCAGEETFETVADEPVAAVMAEPREITVALPEEAAVPVMRNGAQEIYLCDGGEIILETCAGGDLGRTIRAISGFERDNLTVMKTKQENLDRYEFVWAAASEEGERMGRAVILDDGQYHYCLTLLKDADSRVAAWETVCASFRLV